MNRRHEIEPRAKIVLEGVTIFLFATFVQTEYGYDGDGFNAIRLFCVISEDSAQRLSLDQSSSFLMEGAQWTIEAARAKVHHRPYSFEDGSGGASS